MHPPKLRGVRTFNAICSRCNTFRPGCRNVTLRLTIDDQGVREQFGGDPKPVCPDCRKQIAGDFKYFKG